MKCTVLIRRAFCALLAALLLVSSVSALAIANTPSRINATDKKNAKVVGNVYRVRATGLIVHAKPSLASAEAAPRLKRGTLVFALKARGSWIYVADEDGNKLGWVYNTCLARDERNKFGYYQVISRKNNDPLTIYRLDGYRLRETKGVALCPGDEVHVKGWVNINPDPAESPTNAPHDKYDCFNGDYIRIDRYRKAGGEWVEAPDGL